jgi:hypothetical protein
MVSRLISNTITVIIITVFTGDIFLLLRGEVVTKADHTEQILYADLGRPMKCLLVSSIPGILVTDPQLIEDIRQQIPVTRQKRNDLYKLQDLTTE